MLLEAKNLKKNYGGHQVLESISIWADKGEIVALLGASGVGKTTLFNLLAGLDQPDSGLILLNGEEITGQPGRLGYMMQDDLLLPHKTVQDNVALPLLIKGHSRHQSRLAALELLTQFGLDGNALQYPHTLSGGMRQRVALLRTLAFSSEALLLDEPFSALDSITKKALHSWCLNIFRQMNLAVILITHDVDEAIFLADRIYVLSGSPAHVTASFSRTEIYNKTTIEEKI